MTATLIRIHEKDAEPGIDTYAAVRAEHALELALELTVDGHVAETVPWQAIPSGKLLAERELDHKPPRAVVILGTAQDGEWATWHLPIAAPPVPPGPSAA